MALSAAAPATTEPPTRRVSTTDDDGTAQHGTRQPPHRSPRATSRWSTTPTRSSSPFLRHGLTSTLLPKPTPKGLRVRTSPLRPTSSRPRIRSTRRVCVYAGFPFTADPVDTPRRVRAPGRVRDVRGQDLRRPGVRRRRADRHELRAQRDDVEHGGGKSGRRVVHGRRPSEDRRRRRVAHDSAHVQRSRGTGQGSERHHDDETIHAPTSTAVHATPTTTAAVTSTTTG